MVGRRSSRPVRLTAALLVGAFAATACGGGTDDTVTWYVFNEPSGAFADAVNDCNAQAGGSYSISMRFLPSSADSQREQLVRRLAASDPDIDIMGMDVIWTPEFAEAGWITPLPDTQATAISDEVIDAALESATYDGDVWAAPFTSNTQLLWYRTDRIDQPPETWDAMIDTAANDPQLGDIWVQGAQYEGLVVWFNSLLESAGGSILTEDGEVSLEDEPTRAALEIMASLATSDAAPQSMATAQEDDGRLAFESGAPSFMINYPFVWPSAASNAPGIAENMGWARWPSVVEGEPSQVTIGGLNLGVSAFSRNTDAAFDAVGCLRSADHQIVAAEKGGLLPSNADLYDDPRVEEAFPFADVLRATLEDASQRPQNPLYADISLAVARALHPVRNIDPAADVEALRQAVQNALDSKGLL